MSAKIEKTIEVIEEIKEALRVNPNYKNIRYLRIEAVTTVSDRRDITYGSVNDKFIRKLSPDIKSVNTFNDLLHEWPESRSGKLKEILLRHAKSANDKARIENAFYIAPESEYY